MLRDSSCSSTAWLWRKQAPLVGRATTGWALAGRFDVHSVPLTRGHLPKTQGQPTLPRLPPPTRLSSPSGWGGPTLVLWERTPLFAQRVLQTPTGPFSRVPRGPASRGHCPLHLGVRRPLPLLRALVVLVRLSQAVLATATEGPGGSLQGRSVLSRISQKWLPPRDGVPQVGLL